MLKSVLIATDFSKHALLALERAASLPLAPKASLRLIHVMPDKRSLGGVSATSAANALMARWVELLQQRLRRADVPDARVASAVRVGGATDEITRAARASGADVIVAGHRGAGGFARLLLGSTVERILHDSSAPVLLVRSQARGPYLRPLFAVDADEAARHVVDVGASILDPVVRRVDVVHALATFGEGYLHVAGVRNSVVRKYRAEVRDGTRARLEAVTKELRALGLEHRLSMRQGDPRRVVLSAIRRKKPDVTIVGNRAHGVLGAALMASVAQEIARHASCDVLFVPVSKSASR